MNTNTPPDRERTMSYRFDHISAVASRDSVAQLNQCMTLEEAGLTWGLVRIPGVDGRHEPHRVARMLYDGLDRPMKGMICAKRANMCSNSKCFNPAHHEWLSWKDHARTPAGTRYHGQFDGEGSYRSKLVEADVWEILASDKSNPELGERYGVDPSVISHIKAGRRWKHIYKLFHEGKGKV